MIWPANLRALNICRCGDLWQASLQTDEHAPNAFSVSVGVTIDEAVAELVARRGPAAIEHVSQGEFGA